MAKKEKLLVENDYTPVTYDPQYILMVNHLKKYFPITCATCSPGCFTASKRTLPSLPTFSVTQASIQPVFISSPAARSTAAAWKICT